VSNLQTFVITKLPAETRRLLELAKIKFLAAEKRTQMLVVAGSVVLLLSVVLIGSGGSGSSEMGITFEARRGKLDITVIEGGNIEALKSQQIRSAIKGREGTKILSIVEEGYRVTEQDVLDGKILVELDYSQLEEKKLNQEISVETAGSTYIERKAQLEIQINQNISDLNSSRQSVKFSRLDFEKHLGGEYCHRAGNDVRY